MIDLLILECGSAFTSNLEGMFRDIDTSRDIVNSFRTVCCGVDNYFLIFFLIFIDLKSARMMERLGSIELNVHILTSGFWPSYPVVPVNLPHEVWIRVTLINM